MKDFELTPDCMVEKSSKTIAKELLKGSFVIGCDYKNKQLVLENVFHYTESQKRLEIYKLFPDKTNTKRQLKLDTAFVLFGNNDRMKEIKNILEMAVSMYDLFVIDKYNNLYTDVVFDKYDNNMRLA